MTTVTDSYTAEVARLVASRLEELLGARPHLVICHLDRDFVDVNRPVGEGAQGDETAEAVWNDFHGYVRQAAETVGRGILFDIHGQVQLII